MMRVRVVCGLSDTMATFRPTMALSREDFPTLGRPTMATKALFVCSGIPFLHFSPDKPGGRKQARPDAAPETSFIFLDDGGCARRR